MQKIIYLLCFLTLFNCNKTKEMKSKLFPERPYEDAKVDKFYWADSGWDFTVIPLIKPFTLTKLQGQNEWLLNSSSSKNDISDATPIESISINQFFIYGVQGERLNFEETGVTPILYFLINTKKLTINYFEKEEEFKAELKKLNLPEKYLTPDDVFEQYQNGPVLPWFPEDIKKQLEEVKAKKK